MDGVPHFRIAILGLMTIAVYGSWAYGFGVLLDPIVVDTGWSEPSVVAVYSVSAGVAGLGAIPAGWLLDRFGSRTVFIGGGLVGFGAFALAATSTSYPWFAVFASLGGGVYGAFGFYHVTQAVATRLNRSHSSRSITELTVWGAFAGTIFLPWAAWLVERVGWRHALLWMTGTAALFFMSGALLVRTDHSTLERVNFRSGLKASLESARARRFMASVALGGIAISILSVYQVPFMTTAGLTLGAASAIAGARSLAQLGGRIPLPLILDKLGRYRAMEVSFLAIGAGCLVAVVAGSVWIGVVFAILAGYGIGSMSPLVGIHSAALFPARTLGMGQGAVAAAANAAGVLGPLLGSLAIALTGTRTSAAVVAATATVAAAVVIRTTQRVDRSTAVASA